MKISAVVLTKNEKTNIERCLKSLNFCDEILVIDDFSSDSTVRIAKHLGAKVYLRSLGKDMSAQLNFGMSKAHGEWIFFLNADEFVSVKLKNEILEEIDKERYDGFYLKRYDFLLGRWLRQGEIGNLKLLRLVRKGSGVWKRRVHEYFEIKGKTKMLKNPILHYPHPTLEKFIDSINRWSQWHSIANMEEGKKSNIFKILFFPFFKFILNFIFRKGFLDGIHGFVVVILMSFHSYLSWSELWLIQRKK